MTMTYESFFSCAMAGREPFPWQRALADAAEWPDRVDVPTGLGKSAGVIVGWLWRWYRGVDDTPRRLVFCLPMRTLVDQVASEAAAWLERLAPTFAAAGRTLPSVHRLLGGETAAPWDTAPEAPRILVGTQDLLLSRALNRGYALSRYRWPMHFGLLHNDCLWVFDETQLMGVGVTTSAQLEGIRRTLGTSAPTRSLWMSATMRDDELNTVDHRPPAAGWSTLRLTDADAAHPVVAKRINARKSLSLRAPTEPWTSKTESAWARALAADVLAEHDRNSLAVVLVNRVSRAQALHAALQAGQTSAAHEGAAADLLLVHSRFRPYERRAALARLLDGSPPPPGGRIVVATQAVEAGVDLSAALLITELCPWSSFVQRVGRCNRQGEHANARVIVLDADAITDEPARTDADLAAPYDAAELRLARTRIQRLIERGDGCGPAELRAMGADSGTEPGAVLRRKDLIDLFDTTPDLTGFDLDVARYVRDGEDRDVFLAWRDWTTDDGDGPGALASVGALMDEELVRAPYFAVRKALEKRMPFKNATAQVPLRQVAWTEVTTGGRRSRRWEPLRPDALRTGQVVLLHTSFGGYDPATGLDLEALAAARTAPVPVVPSQGATPSGDAGLLGRDPLSFTRTQVTLTDHTQHVVDEMARVLEGLPALAPVAPLLMDAARWHDAGKAHPVFQVRLHNGPRPEGSPLLAKSGLPEPVVETSAAAGAGDAAQDDVPGGPAEPVPNPQEESEPTGDASPDDDAVTDGTTDDDATDDATGDDGTGESSNDAETSDDAAEDDAALATSKRYDPKNAARRHLRHEFASALVYLQRGGKGRSEDERNLIAWLIACHHGKVRLAIRPFPGEEAPGSSRTFPRALGVWNGDMLPPVDLGGGVHVEATRLSTALVSVGEASWSDRMLALRDAPSLGPFRLAYLESLLRAADQRASRAEAESMTNTTDSGVTR